MPTHRRDQPTQGENLVAPNSAPSKQFDPDRTCSHDKCETRLSRYNPTDRCSVHEDFRRLPSNRW